MRGRNVNKSRQFTNSPPVHQARLTKHYKTPVCQKKIFGEKELLWCLGVGAKTVETLGLGPRPWAFQLFLGLCCFKKLVFVWGRRGMGAVMKNIRDSVVSKNLRLRGGDYKIMEKW